MPMVLVHLCRRRRYRAGLLPGEPENEAKRDRGKERPRHFRGAPRLRKMRIFARAGRRPE